MKRFLVLAALVLLLTAGNVFAHDKGDLMLHIEPEIGMSIPMVENSELAGREGYYSQTVGFKYSFRVRSAYYFLDFIGVSTGLGWSGYIDTWEDYYYNKDDSNTKDISGGSYFTRGYLSIPFGVNFSLGAFASGFGLSMNFPLVRSASSLGYSGEYREKDNAFYLKNYFGWYLDVGFDKSGNTGAGAGYGMALRFAGSFTKDLAGYRGTYSSNKLNYRDFSISLVFSPVFQIGNLPIGEK